MTQTLPRNGRTRFPPAERGAALLAVLAMVILLSGFASVGLSRLKATTDRVTDAEARSEAQLLASAGTAAAALMVGQVKARANRQPAILAQPVLVPVGSGEVVVRFADAGSCFNLNSLAPQAPGAGGAAGSTQSRPQDFARMLAAAGIPDLEADALSKATAVRLASSRSLWADASEWTMVQGVTAAHWQAVGQLLCALPNREASALNINSLTADKAPLLVAMGLGPDEARRALANRPREGWTSATDFWLEASPGGTPDTAGAQVVGTTSRWIRVSLLATTARARVGRELLLDTLRQPATVAASTWKMVEVVA
ncbi:MAG: type II secretion system minor pseudopilin GspK [Sandarakinorhabdus sp.]|nr:type II secretion system minor pseudopilin GspK [Sandarakinorhabdus sp.]